MGEKVAAVPKTCTVLGLVQQNRGVAQQSDFYSKDVQDTPVNLSKDRNNGTNKEEELVKDSRVHKIGKSSAVARETETVTEPEPLIDPESVIEPETAIEGDTEIEPETQTVIEPEEEKTSSVDQELNKSNQVVVSLEDGFNLEDTHLVVNDLKLESLLEQAEGGMLTLVATPAADGRYMIL